MWYIAYRRAPHWRKTAGHSVQRPSRRSTPARVASDGAGGKTQYAPPKNRGEQRKEPAIKYQHLVSLALAAALLAGCGGTESNAGSAAVGQSTGSVQNAESSQNTPALTAQKERVTDQFALEKNALSVWEDGAVQHFSVHVPKLECTSPDAVSLFCADPIYIANNGTALGFSLARETENGPEWVAFSAALQYDYSIDCLILTPPERAEPLDERNGPAGADPQLRMINEQEVQDETQTLPLRTAQRAGGSTGGGAGGLRGKAPAP